MAIAGDVKGGMGSGSSRGVATGSGYFFNSLGGGTISKISFWPQKINRVSSVHINSYLWDEKKKPGF
ncbi:hypothetical protein [Planktothricoides raciborskii]|uniref:Uncharacterized protein n=1 Tax=Planktothricoides raciborskii FACHB-1370 TaxID=2949576 RepID=A0ABR8E732_9CYAN|nr:hypothetical protein [Planktothricoides raciborskii]MBD2542451.1 hypothetical protein [Planktothricoides raciborskii FACHB-1370]MBD2582120.1 hypothetical protein [Planktothricoides raciborskii FACHB-1261]